MPIPTFTTHRLSTWQHEEPSHKEAWPTISGWAVGPKHPFLTLLGDRGVGKTHAAFAIGWEWLEQGKTVLYYQVEGLLDALRSGFSHWRKDADTEAYDRIIAFAKNVTLLILDDLGAEHETDWATSKLDQIIDFRYINQKPLIVTTMLTLADLSSRVSDRLREGVTIVLKGPSFRGKGKTDKKMGS